MIYLYAIHLNTNRRILNDSMNQYDLRDYNTFIKAVKNAENTTYKLVDWLNINITNGIVIISPILFVDDFLPRLKPGVSLIDGSRS